jgi:hypothetical protein
MLLSQAFDEEWMTRPKAPTYRKVEKSRFSASKGRKIPERLYFASNSQLCGFISAF